MSGGVEGGLFQRGCGHGLRGACSAFVVTAVLIAGAEFRLQRAWLLAHDPVSLVAAEAGEWPSGSVSNQVDAGRDVYLRECVRCHGPIDGQGRTAPALFGAEPAKKLASFQTSQALYTFIRFGMPQDKPGSLSEEDYWAVLAFVLARNSFIDVNFTVGPETVHGLQL
jgi:mono/diheme cytochrome c family protein